MDAGFRDAFPIVMTDDVPRAMAFYCDHLGFAKQYQFPDVGEPVYVTLQLGESKVAFSNAQGPPLHGRPRGPSGHNRFEMCIYTDDVDAAVDRLRAAGAPVLFEPADQVWGERAAYVADPDGNPILIVAPLS